jgi:hypothetical protein
MGGFIAPPKAILTLISLSFLMLASTLVGFFIPESSYYFFDNIKRYLQFLSEFLYLFFFYTIASKTPIENYLRYISLVFLAFFLLLISWFTYDPQFINDTLRLAYGRLVTNSEETLGHLRFAYLFSDPNTAAYFLLIAVMPWLLIAGSMLYRVIICCICLICCILIQSRGALLAFLFSIFIWLYQDRSRLIKFLKISTGKSFWIGLSVITLLSLIVYIFNQTDIYQKSYQRLFLSDDIESAGSRLIIWKQYISNLSIWPIGMGYEFDAFNEGFYPHSDILRFLYSYGWMAMALFLFYFIVSGSKYPLLFLPALVALLINSLIGEQKLFALYFSTLGVFLGIKNRIQNKSNSILNEALFDENSDNS